MLRFAQDDMNVVYYSRAHLFVIPRAHLFVIPRLVRGIPERVRDDNKKCGMTMKSDDGQVVCGRIVVMRLFPVYHRMLFVMTAIIFLFHRQAHLPAWIPVILSA